MGWRGWKVETTRAERDFPEGNGGPYRGMGFHPADSENENENEDEEEEEGA